MGFPRALAQHQVSDAGAQQLLPAFMAEESEQHRKARKRPVGVAQPVAVVAVRHIVGGQPPGPGFVAVQAAARRAVRVASPLAVGIAAVQGNCGVVRLQAQKVVGQADAATQLIRGDVRHRGHFAVERLAVAVRRQGVEHRNADAAQAVGKLLHVARLPHAQILIEHRRIAPNVGIAQRVGGGAKQWADDAEIHQRPVVRPVERPPFRAQRPVLALDANLHRLRLEVSIAAAIPVLARVPRVQLQLVEGEAGGEGHRVRPGDVAIEADADHGHALQGGAGDVVDAGNRQVNLIEAAVAAPRLVWIAKQQTVAAAAEVAPDGDGVAAAFRIGKRLAEAPQVRPERCPAGIDRRFALGRRPERRSAVDGIAHDLLIGTRLQRQPRHGHPQLHRLDGRHPLGIAAAVFALRQIGDAGFAQIAVHAGGEACHQPSARRLGRGHVLAAELRLAAQGVAQHEVRDGVAFVFAEELRGAAGCRNDGAHGDAEVVLRVGMAVAVAEAAPVLGLDVRNAVLGAAHFRLEAYLLGSMGPPRKQHGQPQKQATAQARSHGGKHGVVPL